MTQEILDWHKFLEMKLKRLDKNKIEVLKNYVTNILEQKSVIIFEFDHLSKLLGLDKALLAHIIHKPEYFYHTFSIKKANGQLREINAPTSALLNIQRWIYDNILKGIPLHESCVGFREKYSIKDNAKQHLNKNFILKLDLKDFFPSIHKKRVISIFKNIGYTYKVSNILSSLCTLNDTLPQGAPTSPYLSNIIAKRMDKRLNNLCLKFELSYTRYADDITISGNQFPKKIISYIKKIIHEEGFNLNENKTKFLYQNNRRIITGISISSNKLTIPRTKKREIRETIYFIKRVGIKQHLLIKEIKDPIYLERLLGYLFFWKFIEPENININNYINIVKQEISTKNKSLKTLRINNFNFINKKIEFDTKTDLLT